VPGGRKGSGASDGGKLRGPGGPDTGGGGACGGATGIGGGSGDAPKQSCSNQQQQTM